MWESLQNYLFPQQCLVCHGLLPIQDTSSPFSRFTCESCDPLRSTHHHLVLPALGRRRSPSGSIVVESSCVRCGELMYSVPDAEGLCSACFLWPPPYRRLQSVFAYHGPMEALIKAYKYDRKKGLAQPFAMMLYAALVASAPDPETMPEQWDVIAPIPGSRQTHRTRGFHHTALLANQLAKLIGLPADELLRSAKSRKPQAALNPQEREKNAFHCFYAIPGRHLGRYIGRGVRAKNSGLRVLLVDDVTTTGYTASSAALALLEAGAGVVDILTLARSPHFASLRISYGGLAQERFVKASTKASNQ